MISRMHYNPQVYREFLDDQLPESEERAVATHVENCPDCQDTLEKLSRHEINWETLPRLLSHQDTLHDNDPAHYQRHHTSFLQKSDAPDSLGRFGRYEIMELLGTGGMGLVLKGYDPALNRYSAIKVLAPTLASNASARKRFAREAKSAAAVVHEHVVPIQTVDEENGLPYLVMPVVDGQSLQRRVETNGPLETKEILRIGSQIAAGLAAAHAQGLVHRDVKPANVLLENGVERVQLTDFGLARAIDDAQMTQSGVLSGTPQYMSPEQAKGQAVDHTSDLFSLGCVLYFMCTGHSPFRSNTTFGAIDRIINDAHRPVREINADVPDWLQTVIDRLLAKDKSDRYASAEQVEQILADWLAHLQEPNNVPQPPTPEPVKAHGDDNRKTSWGKFVALACGFVAILAFGVMIAIETGKGTVTIECFQDNVPVRIVKNGKVKQELTVNRGATSTRILAGEYSIEIEGNIDGMEVKDGAFRLSRGKTQIARIVEKSEPEGAASNVPRDSEKTRVNVEVVNDDIFIVRGKKENVTRAIDVIKRSTQKTKSESTSKHKLGPLHVEYTLPPAWIKRDILGEVLKTSGLEVKGLNNNDITVQVAEAFAKHPWVKEVQRVRIVNPAKLQVELTYRAPVAMVMLPTEGDPNEPRHMLPIDASAVQLPFEDFAYPFVNTFPRIDVGNSYPTGTAGSSWGDKVVEDAAQLAEVLHKEWKTFGDVIPHIVRSSKPTSTTSAVDFDLNVYGDGNRKSLVVFWGRAPGKEQAGEPSAQEKLGLLKARFLEVKLQGHAPIGEFDVRSVRLLQDFRGTSKDSREVKTIAENESDSNVDAYQKSRHSEQTPTRIKVVENSIVVRGKKESVDRTLRHEGIRLNRIKDGIESKADGAAADEAANGKMDHPASDSSKQPISPNSIVFVAADWCSTCALVEPTVDKLANNGYRIVKVDPSDVEGTTAIPRFLTYQNGSVQESRSDLETPEAVQEFVTSKPWTKKKSVAQQVKPNASAKFVYSSDCPTCSQMMPTIDELIGDGFPIEKLAMDSAEAKSLDIRSTPSLFFVIDGSPAAHLRGFLTYKKTRRFAEQFLLQQKTTTTKKKASWIDRDGPWPQEISIRVLDINGKPISNAHVFKNHVIAMDQPKSSTGEDQPQQRKTQIINRSYSSDTDGVAKIDINGKPVDLRIWIAKSGYAPQHAMWAVDFQSDGDRIPTEITFQLPAGTSIGGKIVDTHGQPVADATIRVIDRQAGATNAKPKPGPRSERARYLTSTTQLGESAAVVTDENGKWTLNNVPHDSVFLAQMQNQPRRPSQSHLELQSIKAPVLLVQIEHPDFEENKPGDLQRRQGIKHESLRSQTAVFVLKRKEKTDPTQVSASPQLSAPSAYHFRKITFAITDPDRISRKLETLFEGDTKIRLRTTPSGVIAYATPAQHQQIQDALVEIKSGLTRFAVIPLQRTDPVVVVALVKRLFVVENQKDKNALIVDATLDPAQLIVKGSPTQISQIRELLRELGEAPTTVTSKAAVIPKTEEAATGVSSTEPVPVEFVEGTDIVIPSSLGGPDRHKKIQAIIDEIKKQTAEGKTPNIPAIIDENEKQQDALGGTAADKVRDNAKSTNVESDEAD